MEASAAGADAMTAAAAGVDDAEAAGKVLLRFGDKVPVELGALLDQQSSWKDKQEAAFAERRARRAAPRPALLLSMRDILIKGRPLRAPA